MGEVTMKIGEGLGDLMLSMSQENILKGNPDKAIDLYVNSLNGFTKENAVQVLRNEMVLRVNTESQEMYLTNEDSILQDISSVRVQLSRLMLTTMRLGVSTILT